MKSIKIEYDAPYVPGGKFAIDISASLSGNLTEKEIISLADKAMNQVKIISRYCKVLKALELANEELQV